MTTVGFVAFTIIGLLGGLRPAACRAGWPRWSLVGSVLFSAGTVILVMVRSRSLDEHGLWLHTFQGDRYYVPPDAGRFYLLGLAYGFAAANPPGI
jgi:hypothetical protein